MEAVKDRLTKLGRNAGSFIVDPNADLVSDMRRGDFALTPDPFPVGSAAVGRR